ncbi:MAG: beta-ketoacyl synthase N-terminal-like domain-containing protein, partial [Planctomycetota bacterium]|nr:beta-ketoacyl synthase N-terminal-like domain-containing protein [Planctomycetota bacterium]
MRRRRLAQQGFQKELPGVQHRRTPMTCRPPVAIVGIGGLFPDSPDLETFWKHVRDGVDTSREVPEGRWVLPAEQAFDPEKGAPDKVYSTRACFLEDIELDLRGLAIDPDVAARLDPMVQITLHAGAAAWRDARTEGLDRSRVGVILGNIALPTESTSKMADWILGRGYANELFSGQRALQPEHCVQPQANLNRYVTGLPAGVLARALGLGAGHFTLDAACASSLFALKHAVDELQAGRADAMLSGGLSRPDCLYTQMGFAQLLALSPSGHCSPFDQKGDGLVVGEGAGIVVLKRLDDAVAAGDEIHAVIRGIGLSNDVDGNLLAPSVEGQLRAMRAAYHHAGWQPSSVDLIECHATGTPVGDAVELESLRELWGDCAFDVGQCTIGSVKSNVGHLLTGAGAAGLVKVLLAMREGVLPPTANFETAGDGIELSESPFQVRKTAADWPQRDGNPRRAAVSGFGFGGTNAHVLLEEWNPEAVSPAAVPSPDGDSIVIVGMAARCGDLDDLQAVQHRMLGGAVEHPISEKQNFFGQADPPKGWFLEDIEVRSGRFRIPPTEIAETLPQQLLMLDVADQALRDAEVDSLDRLQIGVFIGISLDLNTTNYHLRWALRARAAEYARALGMESDGADFDSWVDALCDGLGAPLNANRVMGNLGGIVASRVAREFGLGGPSYVLSSEESSGLTALTAAVRGLALGDLSAALVGAVDLPSDVRAVIATDGDRSYERDGRVRPFDRAAAGTLPGDGAACVILKRRCDAERDGDRIYAT